ncbi:MAG: hypothetical protein A3B68_02230 [Candidatus Melainabacteria bacterium RIFCSPHIGHO2_02_FULL_34_12]|nr:MAG: hypothetical protein A3B68_02230 [Candidatus Melainabacteria bacterium RIFCSPHIGHO2_02_FULL_34_12]
MNPQLIRPLPQILDDAENAFDFASPSSLHHAQHFTYTALAMIESNKDMKRETDAALVQRANTLISRISERCVAAELKPGDILTYDEHEGPLQIGNCLWICRFDDLPPMFEELQPDIGYFLIDLSSTTAYYDYDGFKGLRDGEEVSVEQYSNKRFHPDAVVPNGNIKIRREGNTIKILSPKEVSRQVQAVIDSRGRRIFAVRSMLAGQLKRNELTGDEETQARTDLAALEAKIAEMEKDKE